MHTNDLADEMESWLAKGGRERDCDVIGDELLVLLCRLNLIEFEFEMAFIKQKSITMERFDGASIWEGNEEKKQTRKRKKITCHLKRHSMQIKGAGSILLVKKGNGYSLLFKSKIS